MIWIRVTHAYDFVPGSFKRAFHIYLLSPTSLHDSCERIVPMTLNQAKVLYPVEGQLRLRNCNTLGIS